MGGTTRCGWPPTPASRCCSRRCRRCTRRCSSRGCSRSRPCATREVRMSIVEVKDLRREYQQGTVTVKALRGVDLAIEPGEFTALMGPSGSGKTTLLNLIGALDRPSSGRIVVDGKDLGSLSSTQLSDLRLRRLGFIFQSY